MPIPEDDFIPLSALQHYLYCPRQCALIHLDRVWEENVFTAEGKILHERAHGGEIENRKDIKTVASLMLRSRKHGITGVADIVEFHRTGQGWQPYPVEYKRGRPKSSDADRVQLCAQAFCLEDMLDVTLDEGALYYGQTHRRETVKFDASLRLVTEQAIAAVHALLAQTQLPKPVAGKHCKACSLIEPCLPQSGKDTSSDYLRTLLEET